MAKGSLTIYYYSDPQHGWYRVKESWFKKYGIDATKISNCSYRGSKNIVYLEEDVDAKLFFDALEKCNITPKVIPNAPTKKSSRLRNYPRYVYNETVDKSLTTKILSNAKITKIDYSSKVPASKNNSVDDEEILASGFAYTDEAPIFNEAENV